MKTKASWLINVYLMTAAVHLVLLAAGKENGIFISKVLLMPELALLVWLNRGLVRTPLLLIALFWCWMGDVLLQFSGGQDNFFLFGLASFLLGHLFYMFTFRKLQQGGKLVWWWLIPVAAYVFFLLYTVWPGLGEMRIPVLAYAVVITLMLVFALRRYRGTTTISFSTVAAGAILFIISDSLIACNTFHETIRYASIAIMSTYALAQYLIVQGLVWSGNE